MLAESFSAEADLAKAKRLPWVDFNTGKPLRLDWHGSHMDGTLSVIRLSEYIETYHRHPESKAADQNGNPASPDTVGLLGRLRVRSEKLVRIGKEVDRLDDDGASLEPDQPVEYARDDLASDIDYLSHFPRNAVAAEIGMSERRWCDLGPGSAATIGSSSNPQHRRSTSNGDP
jgi:hypothetical protein